MPSSYHEERNSSSSNLPMSQAEHHSFNTIFAAYYGVHEAILIAHFQHWINHNKRMGRNHKDGRTWTYQTRKEIAAWFPYFNDDQVRRLTDKLEKKGVLIKGVYNKKGFDKTVWYAFENEEVFTIGKSANACGEYANPSGKKAKPIPYTKPYTEPNSKEHICPTGSNALFSNEMDMLGHPVFHEKYSLNKEKREIYESLSLEQKDTLKLLRNVPPANDNDKRFDLPRALNIVRNAPREIIIKAIMVLKERIARGDQILSIGGVISKQIEQPTEPLGENGYQNSHLWNKYKSKFPPGMVKEYSTGIEIDLGGNRIIDVGYRMSPDNFKHQIEKALKEYKENNQ